MGGGSTASQERAQLSIPLRFKATGEGSVSTKLPAWLPAFPLPTQSHPACRPLLRVTSRPWPQPVNREARTAAAEAEQKRSWPIPWWCHRKRSPWHSPLTQAHTPAPPPTQTAMALPRQSFLSLWPKRSIPVQHLGLLCRLAARPPPCTGSSAWTQPASLTLLLSQPDYTDTALKPALLTGWPFHRQEQGQAQQAGLRACTANNHSNDKGIRFTEQPARKRPANNTQSSTILQCSITRILEVIQKVKFMIP